MLFVLLLLPAVIKERKFIVLVALFIFSFTFGISLLGIYELG